MSSYRTTLKADSLLLLTAIIWGTAFVAQRAGMQVIGPFAYSATRFAIGALSLVPLLLISRRRARASGRPGPDRLPLPVRAAWAALAGVVLCIGANLQQVGLVYTTAGNAGFITSFYVILVPIIGCFLGHAAGWRIWSGALAALAGLYILCVGTGFSMAPGDLLVLAGALFWAGHILLINHLVTRMDALEIATGQFATCAVLSGIVALLREPAAFSGVGAAAGPILYGGLMSIGVAYTLQIVAQKSAHPAHASIILSMEALFASVAGVLLLNEPLTWRLLLGGTLMLAGMVVSQLAPAPRSQPG